jgi:hypothetical protein
MTMVVDRDAARTKYDAEISALVRHDYVPDDYPIPLVLVVEDEGIDAVAHAVCSLGGSVRHVLPPLSALSAFVPKSAILPLAERPDVLSLEFDTPVQIA